MTKLRARVLAVVIGAGVLALAAMPSCSDTQTIEPCDDIPAGGCPLSKGVACEDPSCLAVYACRPNKVWELDHTCPGNEGGVTREASTDAADAAEASRPFDASLDAPPGANGGPGCGLLQTPDCSLGLALSCPKGCCGCEDLFVCTNGGWTYWATCTE
jgi:hypothetical protein